VDNRCASRSVTRKATSMRKYLPVALGLLALAGAASLLGACHTTAGIGEDLSATGHAISSEAKKVTP
jgi:predicted small secreted protein